MSEMSPCKGCTKRQPGCHARCDAYKAWLDRYHAEKKQLEDSRHRWHRAWSPGMEKDKKYSAFGVDGFKRGGIQ